MGYKFGKRSLQKLSGVNPDLVAVVKRAIEITSQDFSVGEGLRDIERQRKLVKSGKSKTMNSRHLTGHAVDLLPYPFNGDVDEDGIPNIEDWDQYYPIADAMKQAANELNVDLEWGGDWKSFPDGPHFQLSRKSYPQ
jgi:peptidoglycan L-alanyl-D-glutamate endopeptidase CwlK